MCDGRTEYRGGVRQPREGGGGGALFGVASGMGFAALETMGYGFVALLQSQGGVGALEQTLLVRGLLAPVGHAAWSGVACAVLWRERERRGRPTVNGAVVGAFLAVVALHALWDLFNTLPAPNALAWLALRLLSLLVAITSLSLLIRRIREADRGLEPGPAGSAESAAGPA